MRSVLYHTLPYFFSCLTLLGIFKGGIYQFVGIVIIFLIHPLLDHFLTKLFGDHKISIETTTNFSLYLWPLYQSLFLLLAIKSLIVEKNLFCFIAGCVSIGIITGGFGITIAHELIHRTTKWERGLGVYILNLVSYAPFRIEHVHGHHRNVATPFDPATAKKGEHIYAFIPKAIVGVFKGAKKIEDSRIVRLKKSGYTFFYHRIYQYIFFTLITSIFIYLLFGFIGIFIFFFQSLVAISLLEMVDYIEHYGLQRKMLPDGTFEPIGANHSWDTNFFLTNTSLYNLGKHAKHHQIASLPFQQLESTHGANNYPFGYSTAVLIALYPPLWRKLVDPLIE